MNLYISRGDILYIKKAKALNGTDIYALEINFGDDAVFARVALLPDKVGSEFQQIFNFPNRGVQEQLALSARGVQTQALLATLFLFCV